MNDLPSMPGELAARCLVRKLSASTSLAETAPSRGHTPTADLLSELESHDIHCRLTRIDYGDLRHVPLPTLLRLKNTRWALVIAVGKRSLALEDAAGHRHIVPHATMMREFEGQVLDRAPELPEGATVVHRLLLLIWAHRRTLYPVALLMLLAQMLVLGAPQLVRVLIDRAFPDGSHELFHALIVGMVFVALFQSWLKWLERHVSQLLYLRLDTSLERSLLAHVLELPYRFIETRNFGELMQGFKGITTVRSMLTGDALSAIPALITAVALLVIMSLSMPGAAAMVALLGIMSAALAILAGARQNALHQRVVAADVRERGRALEIFTHIATIKSAGVEKSAVARWLSLLRRARLMRRSSEQLTLACNVFIDLLGQLQLQALWIWGGLQVMQGSLRLGELSGFALMAAAFHAAVSGLSRSFVKIQSVRPHLQQTQALLDQAPLKARSLPRRSSGADVRIRDVWFRYDAGRPWVLSGVDLDIRAGEIRHLPGPSGSGKTTLLKLVAGLYEPCSGQILIGGHPPGRRRTDMIYLSQGLRPFNASVLENLRVFSCGAPFERLVHTAELTGLAEWIESLPMGYDTRLSHGGANLSGGQRQLVALTAALASDRPILLLDEATSHLDALAAARLAANSIFAGRTVLYTGHGRGSESNARPLDQYAALG
jgi:ABC-type bacteriocin/lantibiotic exporter with double-glycine peptidase domain